MAYYEIKNIKGSDVTINGETFTNNVAVDIMATLAIASHEHAGKLKECVGLGDFQVLENNVAMPFGMAIGIIDKASVMERTGKGSGNRRLDKQYDVVKGI